MNEGGPIDFEQLRRLVEPEKTYSGEVREPGNELDAMILDVISKFGNDNVRDFDPYVPRNIQAAEALRRPDQVDEDKYLRLKFGINFLTKKFDLDEDTRLLVAYNMKPTSDIIRSVIQPQVVIDRFKPEGGLASRTKFNISSNNPSEIWKTHITDFSEIRQVQTFLSYRHDFTRRVGSSEEQTLKKLLQGPENDEAITLAEGLISVNDEEKRLAEKKAAQDKVRDEEYLANQRRAQEGGLIITPTSKASIPPGFNPVLPQ